MSCTHATNSGLFASLRSRAVSVVVIPMSVSLKLIALMDGDSSPLAVRILSWMRQGDNAALVRDGVDMLGLKGKR